MDELTKKLLDLEMVPDKVTLSDLTVAVKLLRLAALDARTELMAVADGADAQQAGFPQRTEDSLTVPGTQDFETLARLGAAGMPARADTGLGDDAASGPAMPSDLAATTALPGLSAIETAPTGDDLAAEARLRRIERAVQRLDGQQRAEDDVSSWEVLPDEAARICYAKTTADWVDGTGAPGADAWIPWVSASPCTKLGTNVQTDKVLTIDLPSMDSVASHVNPRGDPNVREGAIIAYVKTKGGSLLCVSPYMDDPLGTIKLWLGSTGPDPVPGGWAVADGQPHCKHCGSKTTVQPCSVCGTTAGTVTTADMRGRVPVGWYGGNGIPANDGSYAGTLGEPGEYANLWTTGGNTWHGQAENNHAAHDSHVHAVVPSLGIGNFSWNMLNLGQPLNCDTYVLLYTSGFAGGIANPPGDLYTQTQVDAGDGGPSLFVGGHGGPLHAVAGIAGLADTDNRPPWVCVCFIQRIS